MDFGVALFENSTTYCLIRFQSAAQKRLFNFPNSQFAECSTEIGEKPLPFPKWEERGSIPRGNEKLWWSRNQFYFFQKSGDNRPFLLIKKNFVNVFQKMRLFLSLKEKEKITPSFSFLRSLLLENLPFFSPNEEFYYFLWGKENFFFSRKKEYVLLSSGRNELFFTSK